MTIIAKGTEVSGTLKIEGNIRIDGTVHGNVIATQGLEVGKSGRIIGESIDSKTAVIHGYVEGLLKVAERVVLGSKAALVGDLKTKSLVIEEGAVFHGNSAVSETKPVSEGSHFGTTDTTQDFKAINPEQ